jgi:hypothetical protein
MSKVISSVPMVPVSLSSQYQDAATNDQTLTLTKSISHAQWPPQSFAQHRNARFGIGSNATPSAFRGSGSSGYLDANKPSRGAENEMIRQARNRRPPSHIKGVVYVIFGRD